MSEPLIEESTDTTEDTGRRMDDELKLIAAILRLLKDLDEPARGRVVRYISDRYAEGKS